MPPSSKHMLKFMARHKLTFMYREFQLKVDPEAFCFRLISLCFLRDAAVDAYQTLDGKHFQGRLLHILPASAKKTYKIDATAASASQYCT
jgi:hypothetical protein